MLSTLLLLGAPAALAQAVTAADVPAINAQLFRPSIDAESFLWSDDAGLAPSNYFSARGLIHWVNDPFVYTYEDTGERVELVSNLFQLDVMAAYTLWRIRAGLDLPVYLRSIGDATDGETGIGDPALDLKGTILDRNEAPLGLALGARFTFPISTVDAPLGADGVGWEIELVADKDIGDLLIAANLGTRGVPDVVLENITWGDQFFYRVGAGYAISDATGLSVDFAGQATYSDFSNRAGTPLEALLGGWYRVGGGDLVLRGGVGTGLTAGIGAPRLRAMLGLAFEPPRTPRDRDLDGIIDAEDACPDEPEDMDSYRDGDGCPEATEVRIRITDPQGAPITSAVTELTGSGTSKKGGASLDATLDEGRYDVVAMAEDYEDLGFKIDVPNGPPVDITKMMKPSARPGTLKVEVVDKDGAPVAAQVSLDAATKLPLTDGQASIQLPAGRVTVAVIAEGFFQEKIPVDIVEGEEKLVRVVLEPEIAKVVGERIEIADSVYFETNKAVIKDESFGLLGQVAKILVQHPEITLLRVEGHTDARGAASYNLKLSESRAAAVMQYLVDEGVDPTRLESEGFGETKPLVTGNNDAAWTKNRRVDFFIKERSDD